MTHPHVDVKHIYMNIVTNKIEMMANIHKDKNIGFLQKWLLELSCSIYVIFITSGLSFSNRRLFKSGSNCHKAASVFLT